MHFKPSPEAKKAPLPQIPGARGHIAASSRYFPLSTPHQLTLNPRAEGTVRPFPRGLKTPPVLTLELQAQTSSCPPGHLKLNMAKADLLILAPPSMAPLNSSPVPPVPTLGNLLPSSGCSGQSWSQTTSLHMRMFLDLPSEYTWKLAAPTTSCLHHCLGPSPVSLTPCWDPSLCPTAGGPLSLQGRATGPAVTPGKTSSKVLSRPGCVPSVRLRPFKQHGGGIGGHTQVQGHMLGAASQI